MICTSPMQPTPRSKLVQHTLLYFKYAKELLLCSSAWWLAMLLLSGCRKLVHSVLPAALGRVQAALQQRISVAPLLQRGSQPPVLLALLLPRQLQRSQASWCTVC